jgi:methylthioribose-1-phosphate isomerase
MKMKLGRARPVEWVEGKVRIIDQTKLPLEEVTLDLEDYLEVAEAIKTLRVRGAPAIGVAAAYGIALGAQNISSDDRAQFGVELSRVTEEITSTRPTAINLFKAAERMKGVMEGGSVEDHKAALLAEAKNIHAEEEDSSWRMSQLGAELSGDGFTVLTHCNAGPLATAGYGSALGVILAAREQGKQIRVLADETRPLLQGARLTTWELIQAGVPVTLITDSMSGHFLRKGEIDCVIVGADRIAANGDVANKIGTYNVAVLAKENEVPFYVAAPLTTIDLDLAGGDEIPIEERNPEEVTHWGGQRIAPEGIGVGNPAFDVTPHRYVSAIITEKGVVRDPYEEGLAKLFRP